MDTADLIGVIVILMTLTIVVLWNAVTHRRNKVRKRLIKSIMYSTPLVPQRYPARAIGEKRVEEILATIKPLAVEYHQLRGVALAVTSEVAEYVAAQRLGLKLATPRTPGHDATRGKERIQIKGRAIKSGNRQKLSKFYTEAACDAAMMVLLDPATLDAKEIWEVPFAAIRERLAVPGSRRARGVLSVGDFKRLGTRIV